VDRDFGSTTAVIAYVRQHVTPTVLWSAIGALVTALVVSITWLVTMQSDVRQLKIAVAESKETGEMLHKIDTRLAVMGSKVDTIADEVDRQRARWERVQNVAEELPLARKRR